MKKHRLLYLAVILGFVFYSMWAYQSSLTPYVTFAQAKSSKSQVQVKGTLSKSNLIQSERNSLIFALRDEAGEEVTVVYKGTKPEGMDQAESVVAIGRYNNGQFHADKLLVKCPSKYQGSVNK
ncbi:cytochrome c maturation protein CcmE domain-containing protein [Dendrosporobacter sp. 1207_IL3150]|uniref:cytochrome c maturation protein CcmE domain-containing protein n=1 Tax=Dendrosporobacter sp. 1207_IL3150 TaxID=3084054 RepID=UPI002FD98512